MPEEPTGFVWAQVPHETKLQIEQAVRDQEIADVTPDSQTKEQGE